MRSLLGKSLGISGLLKELRRGDAGASEDVIFS